ncbi:PBAN-type neuropeptides-like isoform X2 [Cylas formicarius]|uniref:PBAN-type neuropeptides-like isoform X2 n=1 Tax=Cylas formicarius TaxID=197179 RepID=UPI0029584388|nr:PBAN-type neuropeptides-like isoform X2 [Cylas formicarius]
MGYIGIFGCLVLFCILFHHVDATDNSFELGENRRKDAYPMWFGPRVGRKKRNPIEKIYRSDKNHQPAEIIDVLKESPLVVVAVKEGKQHNFIPRLGRDSGEDVPWLQESDIEGDVMTPRSSGSLFAPRLGRTLSPYTPRMGRNSDLDLN